MAGFLTDTNIANLTGSMMKHFDTFSAFSNVTVYKEPRRVIANINDAPLAGFGEASQAVNFNYIPSTGVFPTMVLDKTSSAKALEALNIVLAENQVAIKVKEDAKEFIENGRNIKIETNDGRTFNQNGAYFTKDYLGLTFYYYVLDRTK